MSDGRWYKGYLHTHTLKSGGDTSPANVARWYGNHGHGLLTRSDHDRLALVGHSHGKCGSTTPLLIPGKKSRHYLPAGQIIDGAGRRVADG